jgi:putative ABC transport system substrate-binding protein
MGFEFPSVGASATLTVALTAAVILLDPMTTISAADIQAAKIAVLISHDAPPYQAALSGFQASLKGRGVEASYEVYPIRGDPAEANRAVQRIKQNGVRLLYSLGALATAAVIRAEIDVPLTACLLLNTADIKKTPHAAGVALEIPVHIQFQWLQRLVPNAKRIGVLFNPKENQDKVDVAARVAREMGLTLTARAIEAPRDIPSALNDLANEADVVWALPDHVVLSPETAKPLLLFSLRHRIPFVGLSTSWAKAGALYALDRDYTDLGAQCGEIAMAILDGRSPESLPPASPRKVVYAINLQTARHMKITLPDHLVQGAAEVFE